MTDMQSELLQHEKETAKHHICRGVVNQVFKTKAHELENRRINGLIESMCVLLANMFVICLVSKEIAT
jgi:hypothetical protein